MILSNTYFRNIVKIVQCLGVRDFSCGNILNIGPKYTFVPVSATSQIITLDLMFSNVADEAPDEK